MIRNRVRLTRAQFRSRAPLFAAVVCGLFLCSSSRASTLGVDSVEMISISVSTADNSDAGSWSMWATPGTTDWSVGPTAGIPIMDNSKSAVLATIQNLSVDSNTDPIASVTFGVIAGAVATNFTITSTLVTFAPLTNQLASASASVTVTDQNSNGASLTGLFPGPFSFQAQYNGGAGVFASLDSPAVASANNSNTQNVSTPATVIPGAVNSIQSVFSFRLSAGDLGSGSGPVLDCARAGFFRPLSSRRDRDYRLCKTTPQVATPKTYIPVSFDVAPVVAQAGVLVGRSHKIIKSCLTFPA